MAGKLHIEEFDPGRVSDAMAAGGGRPRPLSFWREVLASTGGYIRGFEGEQIPVSLDAYAEADENTMLAIYVTWVDPKLVGTIDPNRASG